MALVSMRQMLDHAAEHGYGVPAFNVNNLEQMRAIMEAADKTDSPVIVQASAGARKYAGAPFLRHLILAAIEEFPHIPVVMHQDHGTSPRRLPALHPAGLQLGDDGRLAEGRRQDPCRLRLQRPRDPADRGLRPRLRRVRGRRAGLPGLPGNRHGRRGRRRRRRRRAGPQPVADRPGRGRRLRARRPRSTPWPSPSAPATAPTSSPSRRPATSCRSSASRKSTRASPTPTW